MSLPSKVLSSLAGLHDDLGVVEGCWPVEPMLECLVDQSPEGRVVSTNAGVDVE